MSTSGSTSRRPGRPSLPGKAKYIRLRESVFDLWKARKKDLGFEKVTDSAFAEILLHRCPEQVTTNPTSSLNEENENENQKLDEVPPLMSTPIRPSRQGKFETEIQDSSDVDVTGTSDQRNFSLHQSSISSWGAAHDVAVDANVLPAKCPSFLGRAWIAEESRNMPDIGAGVDMPDDVSDTESFDDIYERMQTLLELKSDSEDSSWTGETDSEEEEEEETQNACYSALSMDISADDDDEKTLTMVDPNYGQELGETSAVDNEPKSKRSEENTTEILESLKKAFSELTSVKDLGNFVYLQSRIRVITSVDKLLELNGSKCMAIDGDQICGKDLVHHIEHCGSRVEIVWKCSSGHHKKWVSSEVLTVKHNNPVYLNDCLQAAAIIVSGNNYAKFALLAKALNLKVISSDLYLRFQKHCAVPVVKNVWEKMSSLITEVLKGYEEVCLCGDGRNDSPGHCARYCVYTLMEHATKVVVDFEVLDSRETGGNSTTMEREGLKRLIERLADVLPFGELATDASSTIIKLVRDMKEKLPQLLELFHSLDIWHKAKKLNKSLHQAARLKGCEDIKPWIEDIVNHFWFCCQSSEGSAEELKDAWFGVLHHVCGEHSWAGGKCKHSPEAADKGDKPQLSKSSKAMIALRTVVMDKNWLNHFAFYVRFRHTSDLESYNSMMTKYAPKRMAFEYPYFIMRVMLAAIDHNMHLFRASKLTAGGAKRAHRKFSKRTKRYHAEPVKEPKTYDYFPFLVSMMLSERCAFQGSFSQPADENAFNPKQIAPTLGMKEAPPTEELMKGPTRFLKSSK